VELFSIGSLLEVHPTLFIACFIVIIIVMLVVCLLLQLCHCFILVISSVQTCCLHCHFGSFLVSHFIQNLQFLCTSMPALVRGLIEYSLCVKIFIVASFSNAMNPWEILLVPSLRRVVVPGPYAKSRSVSLGLPRSGQT